jgi:uncharacterized protein
MRCIYCDFAAKKPSSPTLDPRLACILFDHFVAKIGRPASRILRVHFFGGEPLVARECVEAVIHYVRAACARLSAIPWFEVTTNGLFDSTAVPLLGDYVDSLVVSLDGSADLHDFNRRALNGGGTFRSIAANIERLGRFPVELTIRMCVTNRSVDGLEAIASDLCSKFRLDILSFEMMNENATAASAGLSEPDPYKFAVGVLRAERDALAHGVRVAHGPSELVGPRNTSCPLGRGTLMLNPDGRLTACYLDPERWTAHGMDLLLGRVDLESGVVVDQNKVNAIAASVKGKPRCLRCFCRYTCAGGCHVDQTPPGCSPTYDDRCRAIRMLTAARLFRGLAGWDAAMALAEGKSSLQSVADFSDDRLTATATQVQGRPL